MPHLVVAQPVSVSSLQRKVLEKIIRRSKSAQQHVIRAKIILFAADGFSNQAISDELTIHRETVRIWRRRWRVASVEDISERQIGRFLKRRRY